MHLHMYNIRYVIGSKFFTFKLCQCLSEESEIYWLVILFISPSKQGFALIIHVQLNTATINCKKDESDFL